MLIIDDQRTWGLQLAPHRCPHSPDFAWQRAGFDEFNGQLYLAIPRRLHAYQGKSSLSQKKGAVTSKRRVCNGLVNLGDVEIHEILLLTTKTHWNTPNLVASPILLNLSIPSWVPGVGEGMGGRTSYVSGTGRDSDMSTLGIKY